MREDPELLRPSLLLVLRRACAIVSVIGAGMIFVAWTGGQETPRTGQTQSIATIPFGEDDRSIGIDREGSSVWYPLFFDVDDSGHIYVPDFYRSRIVVFDGSGRFIEAVATVTGISPRMNFFARAQNGCFVTFDDGRLWCLRADGSPGWNYPFPLGTLPTRILLLDTGIYVVVTSVDGARSVVFA